MAVFVEQERSIDGLSDFVVSSHPRREAFDRIFQITTRTAECDSGDQTIVDIYNFWDHFEAIFNSERANRPQERGSLEGLKNEIWARKGKDDFCKWPEKTPPGPFGRTEGDYCVTADQKFKAGRCHAVVIFKEHDPFAFPTEDEFLDCHGEDGVLDRWTEAAHLYDPEAIYPMYFQNQLGKSGASIGYHQHGQEILKGSPPGRMMQLFNISYLYRHLNQRDYFADWFSAHQAVGLGLTIELGTSGDKIDIFPSLTPAKERQIIMLASNYNQEARQIVYRAFEYFVRGLGVPAFNLCVMRPPLIPGVQLNGRSWEGIPTVISLVDRGDPTAKHSDIGGAELLGGIVIVAADPYRVDAGLKETLAGYLAA